MRIRILSGNQMGCVQDFPQIEGEVLVATGFGELAPEDPPSGVAVDPVEPPPVVDDPPPADPPPAIEPSE